MAGLLGNVLAIMVMTMVLSTTGRAMDIVEQVALQLQVPTGIPPSISLQPATPQLVVAGVGRQHYAFNGTHWVLRNATAALLANASAAPACDLPQNHSHILVPDHLSADPLVAQLRDRHAFVIAGRHFFLPHTDAAGGQPSWETFHPLDAAHSDLSSAFAAAALNLARNPATLDRENALGLILEDLVFRPSPTTGTGNGLVTARALQAEAVDPASITWNLLQRTSQSGPRSPLLGDVAYVQRLATRGGLPPTYDSTNAPPINATFASPYSATYAFYAPVPTQTLKG